MIWQRAAGAAIMFAGAGLVVLAAIMATLMAAAEISAASDAGVIVLAVLGAWPIPVGGVAMLVGGRAIYGRWHEAAPIAKVTGLVTRTVGLMAAFALGMMLILLAISGIEREDMPAAVALGVGVTAGLLLAHLGVGLRTSGQRYPD